MTSIIITDLAFPIFFSQRPSVFFSPFSVTYTWNFMFLLEWFGVSKWTDCTVFSRNKMWIFILFTKTYGNTFHRFWQELQPKLSTTAVLGTEESGLCREVAIVERFKQESMECLPKKGAVSGDLTIWVFLTISESLLQDPLTFSWSRTRFNFFLTMATVLVSSTPVKATLQSP